MDEADYDNCKVTNIARIDDHWQEIFAISRLHLPRAVRFPQKGVAAPYSTRLRPTRFVSLFMKPRTHEEHQAVFRWIAGHHLLFFFWGGIAEACHQAAQAVHDAQMEQAELWLGRARLLAEGDIAAMVYSGDFSLLQYQSLIRPGMEECRRDFAAGMSPESRLMAKAVQDLSLAYENSEGSLPHEVKVAYEAFRAARKRWGKVHIRVAISLQPDDETLRIKLEEFDRKLPSANPGARPGQCPVVHKAGVGVSMLQQTQRKQEAETGVPIDRCEYDTTVLGAPEAAAAYDDYFGVSRRERLSGDELLAAVYRTIGPIVPDMAESNLTPEERAQVFVASDVLLTILREMAAAQPLDSAA